MKQLFLVFAILLAGCEGCAGAAGAGDGMDSGTVDSGLNLDGDLLTDGSSDLDASDAEDSSVIVPPPVDFEDSGTGVQDSGTGLDGSTGLDSGVVVDSGTSADSGNPVGSGPDSGLESDAGFCEEPYDDDCDDDVDEDVDEDTDEDVDEDDEVDEDWPWASCRRDCREGRRCRWRRHGRHH